MSTSTQALTPEHCREYLKTVIDPEIFQNIVDLGLVYAIDVDEENGVDVTMTLTTPHCPMGPQIIGDVKETLLAQGASRADVEIVWQPMWTPALMTAELQRELGIIEDEPVGTQNGPYSDTAEEEPTLPLDPPALPKKKGWLRRLFGL